MKQVVPTILILFLVQIILSVYGTLVFQKEANPFAVITVSALLTGWCFQALNRGGQPNIASKPSALLPWLCALAGMLGLLTTYEEIRKIWVKYAEIGQNSDVLPQLKAQSDLFFSGQFPYQPIPTIEYHPFPVYMPLHWSPIQISSLAHIDVRWSGLILMLVAIGASGYWLQKSHPTAPAKYTLPAMLLFSLPIWAFVLLDKSMFSLNLETVVATWYILLAAGLASKNHVLIVIGLIGAVLSRYTLLFWLPLFAILLWLYEPRKYSFWIWGSVAAAVLCLFVLPFWAKDPSIIKEIIGYYTHCSEGAWLRPDEYTFLDGLSLNMHLRRWLPGTPEENIAYSHYPQIGLQLLLVALGVFYYRKKWQQSMDIYTFCLLALSIMTVLFYVFSPMLFKYYMLMPLCVSAVLCWKTIAITTQTPYAKSGEPIN